MRIIGKTDTGRVRKSNQDDFSYGKLGENSAWAVVCDGMGGANGGNVASSTAVKMISEAILNGFRPDMNEEEIFRLLSGAVEAANAQVYGMSRSDKALSGMGTTVVACIVNDTRAYFAHAGDSRAYVADPSGIRQLTRDHSVVQEMLESGRLTPDEAKTHPQKNIITRALGVEESLDIDFGKAELTGDNAVIICTDGLSNNMEEKQMAEISATSGYEGCADEFIRAANENGGSDNITVVVIFK